MLHFLRTPADIDALAEYLSVRRILAAALNGSRFELTDAEAAELFVLDVSDDVVATQVWEALAASGWKVWMGRATQPVRRGRQTVVVDVNPAVRLRELGADAGIVRDATVLMNVIYPGGAAPQTRAGGGEDAFGAKLAAGETTPALRIAQEVARVSREAAPAARKAALASVAHQAQWADRLQRGWRLDVDFLLESRGAGFAAKRELEERFGVDLVTSSTDEDRRRIHGWLGSHGIRVLDRAGRPTLARDAFDDVDVTALSEASREAWAQFREARSVFSKMAKLAELEAHARGGRVYGEYLVRGTTTGRAVSRQPNLQNLHRGLRPLLTADPGRVLCSLDLSNAETRVAAALSGDVKLAAAIAAGDVYRTFAAELFGTEPDGSVTDANRGAAKTVWLQTMFGAGAGTVADELRKQGRAVSLEEARAFIAGVWTSFPDLGALRDRVAEDTRRGIGPRLPSGRPTIPSPRGGHAALNALIQATAADLFAERAARVIARLGVETAFLGVHDELVVEVRPGDAEEACRVLAEEMVAEPLVAALTVPLAGEAAILGQAWRK